MYLVGPVDYLDPMAEDQPEEALFFFAKKKYHLLSNLTSLCSYLLPCIPLQEFFRYISTYRKSSVPKVSHSCTFVIAEDWQEYKYLSLGGWLYIFTYREPQKKEVLYGLQWKDVIQGR